MEFNFRGKTALVTGAGKRTGIGGAIARRFAECGANIILADLGRSATNLEKPANYEYGSVDQMVSIAEELKSGFGVDALAVEMDVSKTDSILAALEKAKSRFGNLDILVNNAGVMIGGPSAVHDYDESAWLKTIDINLNGVFRVSKAAVPLFTQSGSIINIASRAGKTPPPLNGAYAASKAGVIMLTKVMAHELSEKHIRVNAICPGLIQTDIQRPNIAVKAQMFGTSVEEAENRMISSVPLKRFGTTDEVAGLCLFLASDFSAYITGQALNICGGLLMEV
jgi:NAD(P)-dependent dehydrogenase (short-subunit alcohol dehydrogenase family)